MILNSSEPLKRMRYLGDGHTAGPMDRQGLREVLSLYYEPHDFFFQERLMSRDASTCTVNELRAKKCVPCEGGVPIVPRAEAERMLAEMPGWKLSADGKRIRREWVAKHFMAAMDFFNQVAQLAEAEGHHPDLHLVGYRNVAIELWTHAIGGLSENDFITAAKIDQIPIRVKGG